MRTGMTVHSISLQITGGDVYEASRMSNGRMWIGYAGDDNAPRIRTKGDRVTADGAFALNFSDDDLVQGRLDAVCSQ